MTMRISLLILLHSVMCHCSNILLCYNVLIIVYIISKISKVTHKKNVNINIDNTKTGCVIYVNLLTSCIRNQHLVRKNMQHYKLSNDNYV